ncbi:Hypothetical protein, putative [Bodo saltans]|uniref:Uncharacterized protein n=1 Tax=Bodo saltans TaxID=75058 RepID=A0A0S4IWE6_BODSA|nr:Hypothetical protein, putative [Bodo saltans]|eukprot:CUG06248.1 Hypothetical protein, putative [Bodo saltans]
MQSTSNDIDQNQTVEQPSSRPESADGGADAGDVEAVLLKRFVTETIKHLGPLVFAQLHHHHASVSSPPVENLGNGEHKLSIPIPTVLSNEVSAAATPGTPPPLKIPPVSNGPLSDTLSVTVATPQLSPRSDLLACPTILSVQTMCW